MKSNEQHGKFTSPAEVRIVRTLPGPIERVWDYLTDPEKRSPLVRRRADGAAQGRQGHAQLPAQEHRARRDAAGGVQEAPRPGPQHGRRHHPLGAAARARLHVRGRRRVRGDVRAHAAGQGRAARPHPPRLGRRPALHGRIRRRLARAPHPCSSRCSRAPRARPSGRSTPGSGPNTKSCASPRRRPEHFNPPLIPESQLP